MVLVFQAMKEGVLRRKTFKKSFCGHGITLVGRGCQGFCDNSTRALVMKSVMMGEVGVKNNPNLRDVIYG
jgi:hypothetical protein